MHLSEGQNVFVIWNTRDDQLTPSTVSSTKIGNNIVPFANYPSFSHTFLEFKHETFRFKNMYLSSVPPIEVEW